ncbi:MAG: hypothetical protein JNJ46_05750 [Myxococcales bacterium]|nr:hypothetical protein [Myxococcales bacterium]
MWTATHISQSIEVAAVSLVRSFARRARHVALLPLCGLVCWASPAQAGPCSDVKNAVYVATTPAAEQYVEKIAQFLQLDDANPLPVIWQVTTSCRAAESVVLDTSPTGPCASGACLKGTAKVWPLDRSPVKTCELDANGTHIHVAVSDVFPASCRKLATKPISGVLDVLGPISPYAMVMSAQATEAAIHAEEAHFVFGEGQMAKVKPWLNDSAVVHLSDQDAGPLLLSPRIKLPIGNWRTGRQVTSPDEVFTSLTMEPATALSILPTTLIDRRRADVRVLGFQSIGQRGAFFPDRKTNTFDKQNVRDGHYPLWGYMHLLMLADPVRPTQALSLAAARVADILSGKEKVAARDTLPMQVTHGFVPQCAMRVAKASDGAPLTPAPAKDACHCWFEKNVQGGLLNCGECKDGMTCSVGTCRRNFCEVD